MKNTVTATTDSYKFLPLERALQGLSGVGFKTIELLAASEWPPHYDPSTATPADRARLERLLERYGLTIISMSGHSNLASEEGLRKMQDRLRFAGSMGIRIVNTGVGDLSTEEARRGFDRNVVEVARMAADLGVTVALEPHGQWASCGGALAEIISRVRAAAAGEEGRSIKVNYDTANVIFYSGLRPEDDVKTVAREVAHVHLKDKIGGKAEWNFPGLGHGEIDFLRVFDSLEGAGYQGPFSIEIELTHETERNAELIDRAFADSIDYLRSLGRFDQFARA